MSIAIFRAIRVILSHSLAVVKHFYSLFRRSSGIAWPIKEEYANLLEQLNLNFVNRQPEALKKVDEINLQLNDDVFR